MLLGRYLLIIGFLIGLIANVIGVYLYVTFKLDESEVYFFFSVLMSSVESSLMFRYFSVSV